MAVKLMFIVSKLENIEVGKEEEKCFTASICKYSLYDTIVL